MSDGVHWELDLSRDQRRVAIDVFGGILMNQGFGSDWEPNDTGYSLESLIDHLNGDELYE